MNQEYISLQEATKYCPYSQEYLSLRARQGKLKAVKFGRNWVTKKEWIQEYLRSVEKYNQQLKRSKIIASKELEAHPLTISSWRFGLVAVMVFVLLATGIVFGKEGLYSFRDFLSDTTKVVARDFSEGIKNVREEIKFFQEKIVEEISQGRASISHITHSTGSVVEETILELNREVFKSWQGLTDKVQKIQKNFVEGLAIVIGNWKLEIGNLARRADAYTYILAEVPKTTSQLIKDYLFWLGQQFFGLGKKIAQDYTRANDFVEQKLEGLAENLISIPGKIAKGYSTVNDWVEEKISNVVRTVFFKIKQPSETKILVEKPPPEIEKKISQLEEKVKELEERPPKEIEVERITKIEPIREIEKITEVTKIDDKELAKIKKELAQFTIWQADIENLRAITQKLRAHPTEISGPTAPIYVGYQGIQVSGVGNFASLAVSGSAGISNLGVGGSTVLGSTLNDKLTVNATAEFFSPTTIKNTFRVGEGNNYLIITPDGNLTTSGNISLAGNLNVSGVQNFVGPTMISYSGTSTALTVKQSGQGDIIRFLDGENIVFKISDGGQLTLISTSTPQFTIQYDSTKYSSLAVDSSGTSTIYSTGNIILNPDSGEIRTQANFVDIGGATVRAVGERVFRAAISIFRYSMPAETSSTNWIRISKDFPSSTNHPLVSDPVVLPGATRVYRLLINYSDDIATTATSSWRVAKNSTSTTITEFSLPGVNASTLEEGHPYLTEELPIPDDNWQIEVKVPQGKKIRIFNIFLLAYDKINQ